MYKKTTDDIACSAKALSINVSALVLFCLYFLKLSSTLYQGIGFFVIICL